MSKRAHRFTRKDINAAVVFAAFNGDSYSATVTDVTSETVRVQYFPHPPINKHGRLTVQPVYATIPRAEWHRLTLFPANSNFMVLS